MDRHPYLGNVTAIAIAHRGGAGEAPENTMPAFAAAYALGYRHVETDVHSTADGVVLAFHDDRLDRVTNQLGVIAELNATRIAQADAGYHFTTDQGQTHPFRGRGVRIPHLEEILAAWPDLRINIDPKHDDAVIPLVRLLDRTNAWDRVCVGSFSDVRTRRIRALSRGRACTSMGPRATALARISSLARTVPMMGADCLQLPVRQYGVRLVDPLLVDAAHRRGLSVHVWTINTEDDMNRLLDIGVDGIMTDRPALLREVFAARGLPLDGGAPIPLSVPR